jgi:hypothetical protein
MRKNQLILSFLIIILLSISACQKRVPTKGTVLYDTYSSTYLNLKFQLPLGWRYYSDEEYAQLYGTSEASLPEEGSFFSESLIKGSNGLWDMIAIDDATATSVAISFQSMKEISKPNYNEEDYIEEIINGFGETYEFTKMPLMKVEIGEKEYTKLSLIISNFELPVLREYFVRKIDDYITTIVITLNNSENDQNILSRFSVLEQVEEKEESEAD